MEKQSFECFSEYQAKCCELISAQRLSLRVTCSIMVICKCWTKFLSIALAQTLAAKEGALRKFPGVYEVKFVLTLWVLYQ